MARNTDTYKNMPCLWLVVTEDRYELPIAVCDSMQELMSFTGKSEAAVYASLQRTYNGQKAGSFRVVPIEEGKADTLMPSRFEDEYEV